MKPIRCLLVDDEDIALDILEEYLKRLDRFIIVGRCNNAFEACSVLAHTSIDLIFLDIQMPKLSGIEFIKNIANPPKVIFYTAFDQFALDSYDLDAIDYLLKPVSFERFQKAIRKAADLIDRETESLPLIQKSDPFILVRTNRTTVRVFIKDILYIHSLSNYYIVVTAEKSLITYGTIASIEEQLSSDFLRIHRSYLVAKNKIESFSNHVVRINGEDLPVGRNRRNTVAKELINIQGGTLDS